MNGGRFLGKFRGVVEDNQDPRSLGRLRVSVPDVFSEETSGWALPAVPYAGDGVGLFLLPPKGALVWVEFEHGDPEYPVWTGCFWADGQPPANPAVAETKMLKTDSATLTLEDNESAAKVVLETTAGMKITLESGGITIDDGQGAKVELRGTKVSVNSGALEVT
jgi:uncharacterized protein involved in type VI secretion and phage assembly